jgi:RimJ/RimL family protein N-acetyltransferase
MSGQEFAVRPALSEDFGRWVDLYEAVAAEGKWIGAEAPVDRELMRQRFDERLAEAGSRATIFVAEADGELIGHLGIEERRGVADLGMMVAVAWRGRGVGSALMGEALMWAREAGAHKVVLQVWPHNEAALTLYRRFGFVEEGRLRRHYRRRGGALWDAILMGIVLDHASPGSRFDPAALAPRCRPAPPRET